MSEQEGRYSTHPWDEVMSPAAYTQPWSEWEATTIADAVQTNRAPGEVLQLRRPPLAQVGADPRFGYDRRALGILDVLGETRLYPTRQNDFSGSPSGYAGSIRNSIGSL